MAHPWPNAVDYPTVLNHHLVKAARLIDLSKSSLLYHLSILPFQRRFLSKETSSSNSNSKNFKKVGQNFFQTETEFFLASQFFDTGQFSLPVSFSREQEERERERESRRRSCRWSAQRGEKKGKRSLRSAIAGRLSIVTLPGCYTWSRISWEGRGEKESWDYALFFLSVPNLLSRGPRILSFEFSSLFLF